MPSTASLHFAIWYFMRNTGLLRGNREQESLRLLSYKQSSYIVFRDRNMPAGNAAKGKKIIQPLRP